MLCAIQIKRKIQKDVHKKSLFHLKGGTSGADAIKKFTPSLGIPYLGV